MARENSSSIKNKDTYDALRDKGYSKEKSARIANAQANPAMHPSQKGGSAPPYEDWTVDDLYTRAQELDIDGRSSMNKSDLIKALRQN